MLQAGLEGRTHGIQALVLHGRRENLKADGMRHLSAARVFGRTGRIGCLVYDVVKERWH